jgi:uncharacterized Zn finger protein
MASKFYAPNDINFKNHWATATEWVVAGSNNNTYTVTFTARGFSCDCSGMTFRGKCKHVVQIANNFMT